MNYRKQFWRRVKLEANHWDRSMDYRVEMHNALHLRTIKRLLVVLVALQLAGMIW